MCVGARRGASEPCHFPTLGAQLRHRRQQRSPVATVSVHEHQPSRPSAGAAPVLDQHRVQHLVPDGDGPGESLVLPGRTVIEWWRNHQVDPLSPWLRARSGCGIGNGSRYPHIGVEWQVWPMLFDGTQRDEDRGRPIIQLGPASEAEPARRCHSDNGRPLPLRPEGLCRPSIRSAPGLLGTRQYLDVTLCARRVACVVDHSTMRCDTWQRTDR